ncbi:hypothetical protein QQS21_011294 [Conoideocrella luteorostrata]|uniref:RBR-type E3 ubiquitin transferase n=1 Tax=Conoideocrella luteorostrata TaxID=1105319 RepID=A0AAJ0CDL5_9HYPO|nr:hypothetical protein QQS21_011294 [Conoideocrella luteorostrata]
MDTPGDDDDPRFMELETLEAIYPEIRHSQNKNSKGSKNALSFTFELELPVQPAQSVTVVFPAASSASTMTPDGLATVDGSATPTQNDAPAEPVDSLLVSHLPPLSLKINLPDGYPSEAPPHVTLSTAPQWLADATLRALEDDGPRLWEEAGRDMVAYAYIDHLQREAETVFGTISSDGKLEVNAEHKLAVLDFDIKAKKASFEKETFECGICLDPKKGSKCHKMMDCGHIFCLQCLQDFYSDAIKEGNLSTLRCLTPNCAKVRGSNATTKGKGKGKTVISPSELLQIGLSEDMVKRYVTLKYKTELEADKDTIYCPRPWCNGAARSKKHKKPEGLEFAESGGDEHDIQDDNEDNVVGEKEAEREKANKKFDPAELLCICEDCRFAFCSRCFQTWHGEFVRCTSRKNRDELTEEEQASLDYLKLHTSPCPTCNAPAQKTHGCNHMICSRCDTHFCYLCSSWLNPANPYQHYNQQAGGKVTSCYMRLWELEGGDGDDVGLGFNGGRGPPGNADVVVDMVPEIEEPETDEDEDNNAPQQPPNANGNHVEVALEAPLVLRLRKPEDEDDDVDVDVDMDVDKGKGKGKDKDSPEDFMLQRMPVEGGDLLLALEAVETALADSNKRLNKRDPLAQQLNSRPWSFGMLTIMNGMALIDAEDLVDGGDSDEDGWDIE